MKLILQSIGILLSMFLLTVGVACNKTDAPSDPCENKECGFNGECVEGICKCVNEYYSGAACENYFVSQFSGEYSGIHIIEGQQFSITCLLGSNVLYPGEFYISGTTVGSYHIDSDGYVNLDNSFTLYDDIPRRIPYGVLGSLEERAFDSIKGTGAFDGPKIEGVANYYMTNGAVWTTAFELFKQ